MKQHLKFPGWSLSLLALVISFTATAQLGEGYYSPAINSGQLSHGVGTGAQAFSILTGGSFNGYTNGRSVDNFIGPNGVAGIQEIGGIIAPGFDTLQFNNGAANAFNITNTAGVVVNGALAFNNALTTTIRTNRTAGLAGALQFLGTAIYTPVLAPVAGTDPTFVDGYVSKVNPAAFVYPVGNVTDLRPVTATGTGTFTTAWSSSNVASFYSGALPFATSAINTNGYWEWSGTAAATVTVSIPNETSFTTANKLSVLAFNGTAWTNLGGVFAANTENSTNTAPVTVPATTQALAIGQSVPFVLVSPKAFLMGAMNAGGTAMVTTLRSVIPLAQPYNLAGFVNYTGSELLSTIPINMTDWILVDIRDSTTATNIVATKAAILMSDGSITDVDGVSPVSFLNVTPGHYYIGLRHRNSLAIRSASLIALGPTTTISDFRTVSANAYTNPAITTNGPMKTLSSGNFAMWCGNATSTTQGASTIRTGGAPNVNDYSSLVNILSGVNAITNVYSLADFNFDANVRITGAPGVNDYNILLNILGSAAVLTQHL